MGGGGNVSGSASPRTFPHFMLHEIYQQPQAIRETIRRNTEDDIIFPGALDSIENEILTFETIIIVASGSSRNAGLAGEIMIEDIAGDPVDVEYSSEYCYHSAHAGSNPVVVVITQSGETADTTAAQREATRRGAKTIAISNVADSTIARAADADLFTHAGVERAVPATKSFTSQLSVLYLLALFLARKRGRMTSEVIRANLSHLAQVPAGIESHLVAWDAQTKECAHLCQSAKNFLFLGRGVHYAIAREGSLKMKEISYVEAEGLPAGELLHGPNALVNDKLPVVVLATRDFLDPDSMHRYQKTLAVLEYLKSRGGRSIAITTEGDNDVTAVADRVVFVPTAPELLLPILEVVPLQLFAYHIAALRGCDVDKPRNLAKSVTVE